MFQKLLNIVFPNSESSFVYYILPIIFSLISILLIWIVFLFLSHIFKIKVEKWKEEKYTSSFSRRLAVSQKNLIQKTLTSFRIVFTLSVFFILLGHIFNIISSQINDNLNQFIPKNIKLWQSIANYSLKTSHFFLTFSSLMLNVFLTIILAIWCCKILQKTIETFLYQPSKNKDNLESSRSLAKKDTLKSITKHLLKILVSIVAIFTILQNLGVNIGALLATAGVASVAFALGAQNLIKDFIGGFFILFEDQFTLGDSVELNATPGLFSGCVEKMTLRMVKLRSGEGSLVTIPNGDIKSVKNFTTDWSRIDFKCTLDMKFELEKAALIFRQPVEQLVKDYASDVIGNPEIRPLEKIVDSDNRGVGVTLRFFLKTVNSAAKTKIEMEFNKRLLAKFKEEDVYAGK